MELFKLVEVDGIGRSLFTTKAYLPGDIVFEETPLVVLTIDKDNQAFVSLLKVIVKWLSVYTNSKMMSIDAELVTASIIAYFSASKETRFNWTTNFYCPVEDVLYGILLDLSEHILSIVIELPLQLSSYPSVDSTELARAALGIIFNAHTHWLPNSIALYPIASLLTHSCLPNTIWSPNSHVSGLHGCIATAPIGAGEMITVSYVEDSVLCLPSEFRRELLFKSKRFLCCCSRCLAKDKTCPLLCPCMTCPGPVYYQPWIGWQCMSCRFGISADDLSTLVSDNNGAIHDSDCEGIASASASVGVNEELSSPASGHRAFREHSSEVDRFLRQYSAIQSLSQFVLHRSNVNISRVQSSLSASPSALTSMQAIIASVESSYLIAGSDHWAFIMTKYNYVNDLFQISLQTQTVDAAELAFRYSFDYFEWAKKVIGDPRLYAKCALQTITELRPHLQWMPSLESSFLALAIDIIDSVAIVWGPTDSDVLFLRSLTSTPVRLSCSLCGIPSAFKCSRCKKANYCSKHCQKIHWSGGHKQQCK